MYTIEDLEYETGYSKNTLYNLCVKLGIRANKGKIPGNAGKGLYTEEDLAMLLKYKEAIKTGLDKEEAYERTASTKVLPHGS
jgi:hypothetical protein